MIKALAVLCLMMLSACNGQQEILSELSESDSNEVLVVLDSQKISAEKVSAPVKSGTRGPTLYSINVKSSQASEAMRILVDNRLPKSKSPSLGTVYPSDSSSLIPSQAEEKAKFLRATQGEVENMLKVLPGVIEARVVLVVPDQNIVRDLNQAPPKATGSVAIVYNPIDSKGTQPIKADNVKILVASAVEGLTPSMVTVVMSENLPSTLMGLPKVVQKKPHSTALQTQATHAAMLKEDILMWLFGVLALFGVLLGVFGVIRNRSLRDQLSKALNAHNNPQP